MDFTPPTRDSLRVDLGDVVGRLEPLQQHVITLVYFNGRTTSEVAVLAAAFLETMTVCGASTVTPDGVVCSSSSPGVSGSRRLRKTGGDGETGAMAGDESESTGGSGSAARRDHRKVAVNASDSAARRLHPGHAGNAALDRLSALAARILAAPSSLVTLVDGVAAVVGRAGMPVGLDAVQQIPLAESLCALCVTGRRVVLISDTRADPRSAQLPSVRDGAVGSFLGVPLTSDAGEVVGALCVFGPDPHIWTQDDITTLQALAASAVAELELAALTRDYDRSRSQWDLAIESAGVGSFDWDLRTGRLAWDQPLIDLFGYGDDDLFDESIEAFNARLHPDDVPRVAAALQHAIDTIGVFEAEYRVRLPDGRTLDVQARGRALGRDGVSERLLGAAWDVSSTRRAERQAEYILEAMPVGYLALDTDLRITTVNGHGERLLGTSRTELTGTAFVDQLPAVAADAFVSAARQVAAGGTPITRELLARVEPPCWYDARIWPEPAGVSVFFADVTDRVLAVERQQAAAARDRTVASALQDVLLTTLPERDHLELAGRYLPASTNDKVGGDWYDAIVQPGGATTIMIGDVVGHDIDAAATMGQLRSMLRAFVWESDLTPSAVVTRLDHVTQDLYPAVQATGVVARIEQTDVDRRSGMRTLRWTDAGHPPPLVVHADGRVDVLDGGFDLMLGITKSTDRHDHTSALPPDSTVVLYTDGLIETRDADIDDGIARLVAAVQRHVQRGLDDMLDHVITELVGDRPDDDVAVIAVRCHDERN